MRRPPDLTRQCVGAVDGNRHLARRSPSRAPPQRRRSDAPRVAFAFDLALAVDLPRGRARRPPVRRRQLAPGVRRRPAEAAHRRRPVGAGRRDAPSARPPSGAPASCACRSSGPTAAPDGRQAMRVAALAAEQDRAAPFVLAAGRLAFCGGYDLDDPETIAEAAAAAGARARRHAGRRRRPRSRRRARGGRPPPDGPGRRRAAGADRRAHALRRRAPRRRGRRRCAARAPARAPAARRGWPS